MQYFYKILPILLFVFSVPTHPLEAILNCNFEDTVDLTNAQPLPDGSFLYENLLIPADQVAIYDFIETNELERIPHASHLRGCLCQGRNCIQFCCHPTKEILSYSGQCVPLKKDLHYNANVNVMLQNGSAVQLNAYKDFTAVHHLPCDYAYPLFPQINKEDEWHMFENGTMMLRHFGITLTKKDYCLTPAKMSDEHWSLIAMNCPIRNTISTTTRIFNLGAVISTLFMALIVVVYLCVPGLRNLRGKCFISYLVSLIMGNTILSTISLTEITFPQFTCSFIGYLAYFFYESSFIWLAIIGYDLWETKDSQTNTVKNPDELSRRNYLRYLVQAWGLPTIFTTLLMLIQSSNIDEAFKPGVGVDYCWLDVHIWPALFYFFGLNGLILLCGFVFVRLSREQPELDEYNDRKPIVKSGQQEITIENLITEENRILFVQNHKNMSTIFSLLLLISAISWFLNISAYLEEMLDLYSSKILFYLSDCMNFLEGPLMFYVLVMKPKVLSFLRKKNQSQNRFTQYFDSGILNTGEFEKNHRISCELPPVQQTTANKT